jgi:DNA-binding response OmpR family regulator
VLVVDDDPDVGSTLLEVLDELGYAGRWVADGASALRALVQAPPDVVLLDILMPGLSGLDALRSIRALVPDVPVIMVSGAADEQLGRRALAHGAFDYVVKPVDLRYLAGAIEIALLTRPTGSA